MKQLGFPITSAAITPSISRAGALADPYALTPEERAEFDASRAQAGRCGFAADKKVRGSVHRQGPGSDMGKGATSQNKVATRRCATGVYRANCGSAMGDLAAHLGNPG